MRTFGFLASLFVIAAVVFGTITKVPGETALHLLGGWLAFAAHSLSDSTINWSGVVTAALCTAILLFGTHRFVRWLVTASRTRDSANLSSGAQPVGSTPWPLRRTILALSLIVLMFVAGLGFIGLVHQTVWLSTSPEPLARHRLEMGYFDPSRNLQSIGQGVSGYRQVYAKPPISGRSDAYPGAGNHSWQTRLAPFVNMRIDNIRMDLDWNDPTNLPAFRRFVPYYLNAEIGVLRESHGLAVSHYAGNVHVLAPDKTRHASTAGASNLILAGEVAANFKSWGDPSNLRDPAIGIQPRQGFCGPDGRGANFVMLDGSVRFLSRDADARVFDSLSARDANQSANVTE